MPRLGGNSDNTVRIAVETTNSGDGIDNATKSLKSLRQDTDNASKSVDGLNKSSQSTSTGLSSLAAVSATAGIATHGLFTAMSDTIQSANRLQASMTGLNSVATAFGSNADKAKVAAQELAKDGLMTVSESATGLKNLLASGFSLDEATKLMNRFKDSAAFGRQASLGFGQAVASATEGIKNGNSILVDNAGVTKNLSVILTEAGKSQQDVMNITSDASVRQALFNGIMKETNAQLGDAAKLADSAAGKQAQLSAQTETLKQQIGESLQPALLALLQVVTPIVVSLADWVDKNPQLASGIILGTAAVTGLITVLGAFATAVGVAKSAFGVFSLLVATPIAMPAITVAAALASIALVVAAVVEAQNAIRDMNNLLANTKSLEKTNADLMAGASRREASGDTVTAAKLRAIAQKPSSVEKPSWFDQLLTGTLGKFSSGGYTGPGGVNEVAGVVHKGEYVVKKSDVDQSTGMPKTMGGNVTHIRVENLNVNSAAAMETFLKAQDSDQWMDSRGLSPNRGNA